MNPETNDGMPAGERNALISRREAIRRAALVVGVSVTPRLLTSMMRAQSAAAGGAAAPAYLSARQLATAGAIAERILPRTDTPGAIDVGVPRFLDLMYGKYLTAEEQRVFAAGLSEVEAAAASGGARSFAELPHAEQDALLTRIARASQSGEKTFFHTIKELTLLGYFTSEPVGKNVLHYDPIPGRFDGCVPIAEVGNVSWTR